MTNKIKGKRIFAIIMLLMMIFVLSMPVYAAGKNETGTEQTMEQTDESNSVGEKAMAAALVVGFAAAAGAIGMGMAISKSVEGISRQPEVEGKIRTSLMLGLVFVETAIIYALIVAILIIFVM